MGLNKLLKIISKPGSIINEAILQGVKPLSKLTSHKFIPKEIHSSLEVVTQGIHDVISPINETTKLIKEMKNNLKNPVKKIKEQVKPSLREFKTNVIQPFNDIKNDIKSVHHSFKPSTLNRTFHSSQNISSNLNQLQQPSLFTPNRTASTVTSRYSLNSFTPSYSTTSTTNKSTTPTGFQSRINSNQSDAAQQFWSSANRAHNNHRNHTINPSLMKDLRRFRRR